jgi:hypothetical protein
MCSNLADSSVSLAGFGLFVTIRGGDERLGSYLLSFFTKMGQTALKQRLRPGLLMINALTKLGLVLAMIQVMACAQAEPLSITLVNPKTNTVMRCSARTSTGTQGVSLSGIVEICAKQLEARGFVRVNERNATQFLNK